MTSVTKVFISLYFLVCAAFAESTDGIEARTVNLKSDLDSSATSAKLFNLGSLFGQYPNYPNNNRPGYYPNTGNGYYPNTGNGYYPNTGNGYYPNTGNGYYPNTGNGYYPTTGHYPTSGYYPNGYYQTTGSGIYPGTGYYANSGGSYYPGVNGNGGYGGYGGNGGFRQYAGYWNTDYAGQRNRGFGYTENTDRYGLPSRDSERERSRDHVRNGYRGYD